MNIISKIIYAYLIWASAAGQVQTYDLYQDPIEYQYVCHGTVTDKISEGCPEEDDEYIAVLWNGTRISFTADDLLPGDDVTVFYLDGEIVRILYGIRP